MLTSPRSLVEQMPASENNKVQSSKRSFVNVKADDVTTDTVSATSVSVTSLSYPDSTFIAIPTVTGTSAVVGTPVNGAVAFFSNSGGGLMYYNGSWKKVIDDLAPPA